MPIKILMLEDDDDLRGSLQDYLVQVGFSVTARGDAQTLEQDLAGEAPDVVILDLNLPGIDGIDAARAVRQRPEIGLIMLTGRAMRADRLQGFSAGADHYLVKPADPAELEIVIRNLVGRLRGSAYAASAEPSDTETWILDQRQWTLKSPDGMLIPLTVAEKHLLERAMAKPGQPATRNDLMTARSPSEPDAEGRGLDVLVFRLRRKVEKAGSRPLPLLSARGIGYVFAGNARVEQE